MEQKTNAVRILERAGMDFCTYSYEGDGAQSGAEVARLIGIPPERVFKTLVTAGRSGENYVFMIPVERELDLRRAAKAVGEKSVEMVKSKALLPLTGYIHGGCSPLGMKRQLRTVIDEAALGFEAIVFSAGRIGYQIEMSAEKLAELIHGSYADLCGTE